MRGPQGAPSSHGGPSQATTRPRRQGHRHLRGVLLALSALVLQVVAGCLSGPAPSPPPPAPSTLDVEASAMQPGTFYGLEHSGGTLTIRATTGGVTGSLHTLEGGPVGSFAVDTATRSKQEASLQLAAGAYVIRLDATDAPADPTPSPSPHGTVSLQSGGHAVTVHALPTAVARVTLLDRPGTLVLPERPDADHATVAVPLQRPATQLALWTDAAYASLDVQVRAGGKVVAEFQDSGSPVMFPFLQEPGMRRIQPWPNEVTEAPAGNLSVSVTSQSFAGTLVLEAVSFSAAQPPGQSHVHRDAAAPAFTYGRLVAGTPLAFEVAATDRLVFEAPASGGNDTWLALFGPHDERIATAFVPSGSRVAIDVPGAGEYVVALLSGNATVASDVPPRVAELRPLRPVLEVDAAAPSRSGGYARANETPTWQGTLFDVVPATVMDSVGTVPPVTYGCVPSESITVVQGGQTLAAFGLTAAPTAGAGRLLGDGPITLDHDGASGQGCEHTVARLRSYQR